MTSDNRKGREQGTEGLVSGFGDRVSGNLGGQGSFVLPFGEGEFEQRIDGLNDLLGAARLKVHLAAARADPGFQPGEFHRHALFLELLGDGLAAYLTTAL